MPITEITQYITTNGTVYSNLEAAQEAEAYEQVIEPIMQYIVWSEESFYAKDFFEFLKKSSEAPAFVDALLDVYSYNPHILKESKNDLAT